MGVFIIISIIIIFLFNLYFKVWGIDKLRAHMHSPFSSLWSPLISVSCSTSCTLMVIVTGNSLVVARNVDKYMHTCVTLQQPVVMTRRCFMFRSCALLLHCKRELDCSPRSAVCIDMSADMQSAISSL